MPKIVNLLIKDQRINTNKLSISKRYISFYDCDDTFNTINILIEDGRININYQIINFFW